MEKPWHLHDALDIARSLLEGRIGLIEGCISLSRYVGGVIPYRDGDAEFSIFVAVASETDHLPLGNVRDRWSELALDRADTETKELIRLRQPGVTAACQQLLSRFGPGQRTVTLYRPVGPKELELIPRQDGECFLLGFAPASGGGTSAIMANWSSSVRRWGLSVPLDLGAASGGSTSVMMANAPVSVSQSISTQVPSSGWSDIGREVDLSGRFSPMGRNLSVIGCAGV